MKINKFQQIAILQTLLLTIILNVTAQAAGVDPRVVQELTATGQVKTVIALNLPETTTSGRLRAASIAMRDPIGETQEEVLNSLPAGSYELTYQYSHVPGLAMTVTQASFAILKDHPQVKYIQYDELEHVALAQAVDKINADQVWALNPPVGITGAGVTVAVLDTGIKTSHEDFTGRIAVETCSLKNSEKTVGVPGSKCPPGNTDTGNSAEDDEGHGTHVSGIIVADGVSATNTPKSYKGVALGAQVAAVKVCNDTGGCHVSDIINGLEWVLANHSSYKIKIVNMSIASKTNLYSDSCDQEDVLRKEAIDKLIEEDITVFAATGNESNKTKIGTPACLSNTIAVGATLDTADTVWTQSNNNLWTDILAPGSVIISSSWTGLSESKSGTSMATPMASGVAALMLQKNSMLTPAQIKAKLKKTGVNVTDTDPSDINNKITRPRIDALAAVNDASTNQAVLEIIENGSYLRDQAKLDFGWTITGSPVTKMLTFKNSGTTALTLNSSSLPTGFSFISSFPATINANSQQTVQVKLDAITANNYSGTLSFSTNDPVNNSIQINLTGRVCNVQTVPFSENFESGLPYCWRTISNDFSTRNWGIHEFPDIHEINDSHSVATMSASMSTAVDDDWLILPKITLGNNSQLQFKARNEAGNEKFELRLLTSITEPTPFSNFLDNSTLLATGTVTATINTSTSPETVDPPTLYNYSLSSYAGQTVYLAIRNTSIAFNSSSLVIDDISVTDSTAPNYQNSTPSISNITTSGFDLTIRLDETGTVYYVVLLDSNTNTPSVTQVRNGQDGTNTTTTVKASGYINVNTANSDFSNTFNTLSSHTRYKIYIARENSSASLQDSINILSVTTNATVTDDITPPSFNSGSPSISAVSSSGATVTVNSNENSKAYYVVLHSTSTAPTAANVKAEQTTNGIISGVITKGIINLSANTNATQVISGLTANTAYKIYIGLEDNALNLRPNAAEISVKTSVIPDITPPTFNSIPLISAINSSDVTVTVNINEVGTVYYLVKTDSSVASAGDVTSGQSFAVSAANINVTHLITGLSPNTAYTIYFVAKDVSGNTSAVTSKNFTTAAVATDTTPPSFINSTPSISGVTTFGFTLTLGSNETSTVHYLVLPTSSPVPAATTIKSSVTSANLSINTPISTAITGLNANTSYTVYAVLTDNALNESVVTSTSSTTASIPQTPTTSTPSTPPNYTVIERKDGTGTGKITSVYVGQSGWTSLAALSATPDPDSVFVKWTGNIYSPDCYGDQPTVYVRLNAIKTCTATFDKITADNQSLVPVKLAAYYLPGVENSGQAFVRITNDNSIPVTVKGTLYHATGQLLGIANCTLIQNLAPQATTELTTKDLAKLCSAPAWTGLAWLHITTSSGLKLLNLLENDNKMISNLTTVSTDNVLYNLPPSTHTEQTSILLINTSNQIQPVTATLYGMSGQILGQANTTLAEVAARGIFSISIKQLEVLVGTQPWTGQVAKLQIHAPEIKTMAILLSQNAAIMNLTPTHDNAAFNIPGATNLDQAFVYITNTTNTAISVTATLYHQDGYLLGTRNSLIINSLAPHATQMFSVPDLEKLFKVPTWQKRARLQINSPANGIKVMSLIHNNFGTSNLSSISNQAYYLPNSSLADKAYIRITNTTDLPVTVNGILYGENGQILGNSVLIPQLAAQTTNVISMPLLENLLKTNSWMGKARLVLNPLSLQVMGTVRSNTGQLLDMSDTSHE